MPGGVQSDDFDLAVSLAQREAARLEEAVAVNDFELAVGARMLVRAALRLGQRMLGENANDDLERAAQLATLRARVARWFEDGALPLGAARDREEALSAIRRVLWRVLPLFAEALKSCPELMMSPQPHEARPTSKRIDREAGRRVAIAGGAG